MSQCARCSADVPKENTLLHELSCRKTKAQTATGSEQHSQASKISKQSYDQKFESSKQVVQKSFSSSNLWKESQEQRAVSDHLFALSVARAYEDEFEQEDIGIIHATLVAEDEQISNSLLHKQVIPEIPGNLIQPAQAAVQGFEELLKEIELAATGMLGITNLDLSHNLPAKNKSV